MSSNSGRTIGDEYQRTLGAFFAIYWLGRLHIDGQNGFCFGVDDNWNPPNLLIQSSGHRAFFSWIDQYGFAHPFWYLFIISRTGMNSGRLEECFLFIAELLRCRFTRTDFSLNLLYEKSLYYIQSFK